MFIIPGKSFNLSQQVGKFEEPLELKIVNLHRFALLTQTSSKLSSVQTCELFKIVNRSKLWNVQNCKFALPLLDSAPKSALINHLPALLLQYWLEKMAKLEV